MNSARSVRAFLELAHQRVVSQHSTRFGHCHHGSFAARLGRKHHLTRGPRVATLPINQARFVSYEQQAKELNQKNVDRELDQYDAKIAEENEKQIRAPWHREGSQDPPVHRQREASAMTKGKHRHAWPEAEADD